MRKVQRKQYKKLSDSKVIMKKKENKVTGAGFKKTFKNIVNRTKKHINKLKPKCKKVLIKLAHESARELATEAAINLPRIIPIPKTGGFLPLIPIFAGLSAAGSIAGGVSGIVKAVNSYQSARKRLAEMERHNKRIEGMCIGKGLHLKPYKDGLGIYVSKKKN